MPEFTPNTIMLERHADKGNEPWEIYAWCVRDMMTKFGNFEPLNERLSLKERQDFERLIENLYGNRKLNTIKGEIFLKLAETVHIDWRKSLELNNLTFGCITELELRDKQKILLRRR